MRALAPAYEGMGVADHQQLRCLVCEGPFLLAWVGAFDPAPMTPRQESLFRAIVPALRDRLALEARLGGLPSACDPLLSTVLEHVASPTYVVDRRGRPLLANALARSRLRAHRRGVEAMLGESVRARGADRRVELSPLVTRGISPMYLAIERTRDPRTASGASVPIAAKRYCLTRREQEVLELLVRGQSNRNIGLVLGCSERTVEVHVAHILTKTDCASRSEIVARVLGGE
ncbi:MAG: hypothetical protein IT378_19930 [Sandaracinaceae bacterium]|nr:hypothetical protein [Sandaracinaceae bacterium]